MPKVQSRRNRVPRSEPFETIMTDDPKKSEEVDNVDESAETESNRAVYKRQREEWRRMKNQVAQIKKQRKALTKKQRDRKKELSKEIKLLLSTMREKHEAELKALGLVPDKSMMDLDDEVDSE